MTVINILNEVQSWFKREVCPNVNFKKPPLADESDTEFYDYELVQPDAYIMYPPNENKFPSVTIQTSGGDYNKLKQTGEVKLRFLFATWNTGKHIIDEGNVPTFEPDNKGYIDVWNFIDYVLNRLSDVDYIGEGVRLKHEDGIQFGPMTEQDTMVNYYPYWCGWISCTVHYGKSTTKEDLSEFL